MFSFNVSLSLAAVQRGTRLRYTEKIDQDHTKTICWKCDGFVMVFSEKPAENHHIL